MYTCPGGRDLHILMLGWSLVMRTEIPSYSARVITCPEYRDPHIHMIRSSLVHAPRTSHTHARKITRLVRRPNLEWGRGSRWYLPTTLCGEISLEITFSRPFVNMPRTRLAPTPKRYVGFAVFVKIWRWDGTELYVGNEKWNYTRNIELKVKSLRWTNLFPSRMYT